MYKSPKVSVIIPAHNEEQTLTRLIPALEQKVSRSFDITITVVDDHSTDNTSKVADGLGTNVVKVPEGHPKGKGEAIFIGICSSPDADIYVTCDADLTTFTIDHLVQLVAPLTQSNELVMSRAGYSYQTFDRDLESTQRVTRLMARPLLDIFFPALAHLRSPLAGEIAFRSVLLERVRLLSGYSVDVGLLIDTFLTFGRDSILEIDLGPKHHRHHSLELLTNQAKEVATAILLKAQKLSLKDIEALRESPFELPEFRQCRPARSFT